MRKAKYLVTIFLICMIVPLFSATRVYGAFDSIGDLIESIRNVLSRCQPSNAASFIKAVKIYGCSEIKLASNIKIDQAGINEFDNYARLLMEDSRLPNEKLSQFERTSNELRGGRLNINYSDSSNPIKVTNAASDAANDLTIDWEGKAVDILNVELSNIKLAVNSGNLNVVGVLRDSKLSKLENVTLTVGQDGKFGCGYCELLNNTINISGGALFVGSTDNGNSRITVDAPNGVVRFGDVNFQNPHNTDPYITVSDAKAFAVETSTFKSKGNSVIQINRHDANQVVMIAGNRYLKEGSAAFDYNKLINASEWTRMSVMKAPVIEYLGHDSSFFKVAIKSDFDESAGNSHWGANDCSAERLRGGRERHINFEPYLISDDGAYPIGFYGYEKMDDTKYITIKLDRNAKIRIDNGEWITRKVANGNIVLLVHCEGTGTTKFSNEIKLTKCPDGQTHNGTACVSGAVGCASDQQCEDGKVCIGGECVAAAECASDEDCEAGKVCEGGFCKTPPPPTGCTTNDDCGAGEECKNGQCAGVTPTPPPECASDAECGSGKYCEAVERSCQSCSNIEDVDVVCRGSTSVIVKDGQEGCEDDRAPVCPVNAEERSICGATCVCKAGFISIAGTMCVNPETSRVCPQGQNVDIETQACSTGVSGAPRKGGGGCSLIKP